MTTRQDIDDKTARRKAADRSMWALGDYHRFATELIWDLGPILVAACGIGPGDRVLDVAAGTGNTALRAAAAGAQVVASDLTPENFEAGRREAAAMNLELEWVEGDAEDLPFEDGSFDVVTSSFGAMWAPRHSVVADELVRVCRPGGTVGMLNFTPEGLLSGFLQVFAPYAPAPPDASAPPTSWGNEDYVRSLFGDRIRSFEFSRREYVEQAATPMAYRDFVKQTFGPAVAIYSALTAEQRGALDRDFLDFATQANRGTDAGPAQYWYEYLLVVGRTADA